MGANKVFVSPGVYTSEKDLTFVTKQVGVTTLGLVGEAPKGPAFQPLFITNYDEYMSFFGGLNPEKFKGNNLPKYEMGYIAKSYLTQSNQLYITRVLGLSGYDAGPAWAITLDAALDPSTEVQTSGPTTDSNLISFTATTGGTLTTVVFSDPFLQTLYSNGEFSVISALPTMNAGDTLSADTAYVKSGVSFSGANFTLELVSIGLAGTVLTGVCSGITSTYSGTSYADAEDRVIAVIRSKGAYSTSEILNFYVTGSSITFDPLVTGAANDPLAMFKLTGSTTISNPATFSYELSFDKTKTNYIEKVLGNDVDDTKAVVFMEEFYPAMLEDYINAGKAKGINLSLTLFTTQFKNFKQQYTSAVTPYILSELRGTDVMRLFRLHTISDGEAANDEIKISFSNISFDERTFDVLVRKFYDTDANPVILEKFADCSMDPTSKNYIARKIGTLDGEYELNSSYIMVELDENAPSDAIPAGFEGIPQRDYVSLQAPVMQYKQTYDTFEKKRKAYLGISDIVGIDTDMFDYKGLTVTGGALTAHTTGFHMDSGATIANIAGVVTNYSFDTGNAEFRDENDVIGTDYEKLYSRKFTTAPYGGFDGWDIYRTKRTNTDQYVISGTKGQAGLTSGVFTNRATSNGENGITSDYYAYFEGLRTFSNPRLVNINVFATPGIDTFDHTNLVEEAIEIIEHERADSVYIVTTPDTDADGVALDPEDVVSDLDGEFDSNYTATYWPWLQMNDAENNVLIWLPPTLEVVRNIALTDTIAFPWFATAGVNRGKTNAKKPRIKLTQEQTDTLYEGRVNPLVFYPEEGTVIWGNKTMQVKDSALDRLNVRRLLLQARKLIAAVGIRLLFEPNDSIVRNQFLGLVNPILENIRKERGLIDFRVQLDVTPESIDRNELNGKIFIKPTPALEVIQIEFNVTNSGASFDDI